MNARLAFCVAALFVCTAASAQSSRLDQAAQLLEQQSRRGKGEFVTYLTGAASAYRWSEASQGSYCPPASVQLDGRSYARLALQEYRRSRSEYVALSGYPLEILSLALLRGLRNQYPCDRTSGVEAALRAE